ncbi:hypothetical protein Poli38472_004032 [Pythium oligandrum]|uniref:B-block binding subunit of TFIIIC domain-containing protein n=1 Tax=Pythium oligandrum TaxID=41045 RepID=A0A8K1CPJ2_PYTOL|nr:hypothetical protein Poli38472_004032 [Pythium oligandrum]|eukprot:TMW66267.1 hypothetical protein Poli38472_004032 [Pythium oligandrum]
MMTKRPQELVAAAMDYVALEGRAGVAVSQVLDALDAVLDTGVRRHVWKSLQRQQARGVLQFYYEPTAVTKRESIGKKRKRPTSNGSRASGVKAVASDDEMDEHVTRKRDHQDREDENMTIEDTEDGDDARNRREIVHDVTQIPLEDIAPTLRSAKRLMVVACEELRFRAMNIPRKAVLAEFGDDHLRILEAIGRARTMGITIPELCGVFDSGSSVKKVHNSLDTLISYNLVIKRMMIVARPSMRRLNIVHLPRFAADFSPEMFDASAEFESDDLCKKILSAAAEAYLRDLPAHSCVLYDLGRDLGFQKRHLEVLKNHIVQESKRDERFPLEFFQAVLQPSKSASTEPKILNCVRYKPATDIKSRTPMRGMTIEMGLLNQIYRVIEDNGENGTTIIDLRNEMVLPGNKLPYKLVSILAGTYGLKAEAIILGKNKAFRLYPGKIKTPSKKRPATTQLDEDNDDNSDADPDTPNKPSRTLRPSSTTSRNGTTPENTFSVRANIALKVALGGTEVEGTRTRRRDHILSRLADEKIISISSLRASMFNMERQLAAGDDQNVGMIDTRSVTRIAIELEKESSLRLVQLPLPARNVSTKFRALRCVVLPGYEQNEQFIQGFVKNYCRDERLRRVHQNADQKRFVRFRPSDSHDDGFDPWRSTRAKKRPRADQSTSDPTQSASSTIDSAPDEVVSYRVRRFLSQEKSSLHNHQYRRLGFAYGVMYRCKEFHRFLWSFLHEHTELHLRDDDIDVSIDDEDEEGNDGDGTLKAKGDSESKKTRLRGIVFSRETVLHRMPVHLYIQVFSGGAVLNAHEYVEVENAVKQKQTFDVLPESVRQKIWAHESERTAKVLGTLNDLQLIVPHKIGMKNLIKILRAGYSDDQDGVLSQALKDNALGGLFRLRRSVKITLDDRVNSENGVLIGDSACKGMNDCSVIRIVGTTEKSYSFGSMLPLGFEFSTADEIDRYWETLQCLCLEKMVMEVPNPIRNASAVCEVPKPVKTRARRMYRILAWIAKSQKAPSKPTVSTDAQDTKRNGIVSRVIRASSTRRRKSVKKVASSSDGKDNHTASNGTHSSNGQTKLVSYPGIVDGDEPDAEAYLWSETDERQLVAYFIDDCRSRWKIPIPMGLQRDSETIAFRVPWLSRIGFGLVSIARKLGRRKIDVKKRLKVKLTEPDAKLMLEAAKREMVETLNPAGTFDEEVAIRSSPRLTALFRRAVMMIVSPQDEYHPLVAEELISFWNAEEIRLVWRYLWLKHWIVRATERERIRGYAMSQRLHDFLKFVTLSYPLELFRQAAEQEAMVHSTLEEIADTENTDRSKESDQIFEAEFPADATPGQCALELGCQVMGICTLLPEQNPLPEEEDDMVDLEDPLTKKPSALTRKRQLRFLNYKNNKEGTGFAAHLAKRISFKNPSVLTDSWHVETKVHAVTLEDPDEFRRFEAFSCVLDLSQESELRGTKRHKHVHKQLLQAIEKVVRARGECGISLDEMVRHLRDEESAISLTDVIDPKLVLSLINQLLDAGVFICVNDYSEQRYVVREHGDFWLLRPYSLIDDERNPQTKKVVFEGEKDMLSFPWLRMDGSTNHRFLFSLQRKLLSFVIMFPGITEENVYRRLEKLLTLQDTREAMALLVEEGLVYTRAISVPLPKATVTTNLFGSRKRRREALSDDTDAPQLVNLVGNVLNFDRSKYVVHYFPHLECIQRFGSIIQDYQSEAPELQRL